jgi:hypothetical protein
MEGNKMSDRPTPETDARTYVPSLGASTVPAEFARQLEQQRNEARELLAGIEDKIRLELGGHPDSELWGEAGLIAATMRCVDAVSELTEQRDEARKQIDDYRERHDLLPISWEL